MTTSDTTAPPGTATATPAIGSTGPAGTTAHGAVASGGSATADAATDWCDRCGEPAGTGDHVGCRAARQLEPPRYCAHCRRRMKVQVLPVGWSAICVAHGEIRG